MRPRLMTEYSVRKMLVKPRLGKRRWSGIWPPSKPRIMCEPERERWPLWPRVEVLPMPEPIPRPTRFLLSFAFFGARRLERLRIAIVFPRYNAGCGADSHMGRYTLPSGSICLSDNADEMGNLSHHTPNR